MLIVIFVLGGWTGWALTGTEFGAVVGALVAAAVGLMAQYAVRTTRSREAAPAEPVDLSAPTPARLTPSTYAAMPLASRNAVVARLVAGVSGEDAEIVAALLPNLMGRKKAAVRSDEEKRQAIMAANRETTPLEREAISAACQGELRLAAQASLPQTDRAREYAAQTLGEPASEAAMKRAALKARLGTGQSLAELVDDAVSGRVDLSFAVGTIRRVGEFQAREFAKMR